MRGLGDLPFALKADNKHMIRRFTIDASMMVGSREAHITDGCCACTASGRISSILNE